MHKTACELVEDEVIVHELLTHLGNLVGPVDDCCSCNMIADNFYMKGVITLLPYGPVDALSVHLVFGEE